MPRYRVVLILGAGYVVVFIGVAVLRLWWDDGGEMNLQSAASLVPSVILLWGVGSLSFLPLIWTLRRFRRSRWIPIVAYAIALPFSLLGALFGGLLGPLGVLVYAVAPLALAVGISFGIQAILDHRRPRAGLTEKRPAVCASAGRSVGPLASVPVQPPLIELVISRCTTTSHKAFGPGTYSTTWDSRDEAGRPLATGVYLCP